MSRDFAQCACEVALAEIGERRVAEDGEQREGGRKRGPLCKELSAPGGEVVAVLAEEGACELSRWAVRIASTRSFSMRTWSRARSHSRTPTSLMNSIRGATRRAPAAPIVA
ncbi:hypothetical protein ASF53_11625 [Methylobacterium sp. Leaf123]|nr:hypothetical protein ASF53_11625 [Methylobacterium sp. Leaf123]